MTSLHSRQNFRIAATTSGPVWSSNRSRNPAPAGSGHRRERLDHGMVCGSSLVRQRRSQPLPENRQWSVPRRPVLSPKVSSWNSRITRPRLPGGASQPCCVAGCPRCPGDLELDERGVFQAAVRYDRAVWQCGISKIGEPIVIPQQALEMCREDCFAHGPNCLREAALVKDAGDVGQFLMLGPCVGGSPAHPLANAARIRISRQGRGGTSRSWGVHDAVHRVAPVGGPNFEQVCRACDEARAVLSCARVRGRLLFPGQHGMACARWLSLSVAGFGGAGSGRRQGAG